jgi:exopolyphosphatase/guanosine-5'-triphosphate,3'-diphosphate pyrophosphatase
MLLTRGFLVSDPPQEGEARRLVDHVDGVLQDRFPGNAARLRNAGIVGTGGTVTTLAAMIHGIPTEEIGPEKMNGLGLKKEEIEEVLGRIRNRTLEQRLSLHGLDRGRVDVILAGTLTVLRILNHFEAPGMTVSVSDLLEGLLIADEAGR